MKILIVDDEALIRIGMRSIIPWETHGYHVVGEARDGLEALEMAHMYQPDIVLVDIVMPRMDGIDFIRRVRNDLPLCKFVILSCKDNTQYYKEAISLGVSEYILKGSISPEKVIDVLDKISIQIRKERIFEQDDSKGKEYINRYAILSEFFNMVVKGRIQDPALIKNKIECYNLSITSSEFYIILATVDHKLDSSMLYEDSHDDIILNICREVIDDLCGGFVFKDNNDSFVILMSIMENCDGVDIVKSLCYRIQETINQCLDLTLSMGVSKKLYDFMSICDGYKQAVEASTMKFFQGDGKIYFSSDIRIEEGNILHNIKVNKEKILHIDSLLEISDITAYLGDIRSSLLLMTTASESQVRKMYLDILYHIVAILRKNSIDIKDVTGIDLNTIQYIYDAPNLEVLSKKMLALLGDIQNYCSNKFQNRQERLANTIKQYISENIGEKIFLENIAEEMYLSPNYLSRLFKEETGENIHDFTTRLKIEKSKELLYKGSDLYEVSEMLGFSSVNYFIKVFKIYTGQTPKHFTKFTIEPKKRI
jgi:two-component system response regulator YesN